MIGILKTKMLQKIEISHRTIIFTVLFLLGLLALYQIRQLILVIFVSIILMSALNPAVDRLERFRLPRWLAILFLYILIFSGFGLILGILTPPLVDQTSSLINRIPTYLRDFKVPVVDPNMLASQISQLGFLPANILKFTLGLFSNIIGIFFLAIVTFYLLLEHKKLNRYLLVLFSEGGEKRAEDFVNKVEKSLGDWVRGELVLMTIIGVMTYIGLTLLGIEFALPLAILAGILEIVPGIGPVISAVPGILLGLTISPVMGLAVAALYFLIQQLENSLIAPKVIQRAVGVNPLVTILSLAIGFKLGGVIGAILAVPIFLVLQAIISQISLAKRFKNL